MTETIGDEIRQALVKLAAGDSGSSLHEMLSQDASPGTDFQDLVSAMNISGRYQSPNLVLIVEKILTKTMAGAESPFGEEGSNVRDGLQRTSLRRR